MNRAEAVGLVKLVASICPEQRIDHDTADAWALVLDDVNAADAMIAVRAIARRPQPHDRKLTIGPDQILVEVRLIRRRRVEAAEDRFELIQPGPDYFLEHPDAYRAQLAELRRRAADGEFENTSGAITAGPAPAQLPAAPYALPADGPGSIRFLSKGRRP